MANPFVHVELNTRDLDTSKKFYAGLFDWKLEEMTGGGDYSIINVGEGTGGGMMKNPVPGMPDFWLPYILVDDVKASTQNLRTARNPKRFLTVDGSLPYLTLEFVRSDGQSNA